jgi:hypothetical protein
MYEILEFQTAQHSVRAHHNTEGVTAYYTPLGTDIALPEYGTIQDVLRDNWVLVTVIPETTMRRTYVFSRPATTPERKRRGKKEKKQ